MINLGSWMNGILIGWGVDPKIANTFDEMIIAALLVILAIGLDYLCQAIFVGSMKKLAQHTHYQWDSLLLKRKVVHHLVHTIPGILVYALLPLAFIRGKGLLLLSQKICAVYIVFALLLAINGFILVFLDMYNMRQVNKNRPIKGFMQVLQVLLFFIGGIVIIAILIGKSPASLFAGLGASAAILMLVFKDTILGFVAGIQLSANDMLRPGDWITVPGSNANGIVQEITLNTVKIQNFDNTISTIPPYTLVSASFQNWRGMRECGGRRIKRSVFIDARTIHRCTPEETARLREKGYLAADTSQEIVNLQALREYLANYLRNCPDVRSDLMLMVRTLQPTSEGVPLEFYCFTRHFEWIPYEAFQSALTDRVLTLLPEFGLQAFQRPAGTDLHERH